MKPTDKKKKVKGQPGRPQIEIDWKAVNQYLIAGCSGQEIAGFLGIHPDTLYLAVKRKYNQVFTEYSAMYKQKGDAILKAKQFEAAINDKNISMLIWLGKQRLGQKDKNETDLTVTDMVTQIVIEKPQEIIERDKKAEQNKTSSSGRENETK